jgi:hypothetical protein
MRSGPAAFAVGVAAHDPASERADPCFARGSDASREVRSHGSGIAAKRSSTIFVRRRSSSGTGTSVLACRKSPAPHRSRKEPGGRVARDARRRPRRATGTERSDANAVDPPIDAAHGCSKSDCGAPWNHASEVGGNSARHAAGVLASAGHALGAAVDAASATRGKGARIDSNARGPPSVQAARRSSVSRRATPVSGTSDP